MYLERAVTTSLVTSGGLPCVIPFALAQSIRTTSATCENTPLARHSRFTAKFSLSSFARRSTSEICRSSSYAPRDATTDCDILESANPYVSNVNARSAWRPMKLIRGELVKRWEDRVERQLNSVTVTQRQTRDMRIKPA